MKKSSKALLAFALGGLVTTAPLAGAAPHARAAAQDPVSWYTAIPFFCPSSSFTRFGQRTMCAHPIYRAPLHGSAVLFFPNMLARDSDGSIYYTRTIKVYKVVGRGRRSHVVEIGEQRGIGALSTPNPDYDNGTAHWVWEPLSELLNPTFGVRRTDSERPVSWSCNAGYLFYVATGRGEVNGMAQITLTC
jgi:hypothetical protein